jgi:hemoglobin-like flavoprotein
VRDYRALFDKSFGRLVADPDEYRDFLTRFYEHFVASSDEAARHFRGTDMVRQRRMLARSLDEIIDFSRTGVASEYLRQVARRHSRDARDVRPELYALWLDSLIATAQEFLPGFDQDSELAWRVVLAPGVTYMQFRYDRP